MTGTYLMFFDFLLSRRGSVITDFTVNLYHKYYERISPLQNAILITGKLEQLNVAPVGFTLSSYDGM